MFNLQDCDTIENLQEKGEIIFKKYAERIYGKNFSKDSFGDYKSDEIRDCYNGWCACFDWLVNELKKESTND